MCQSGTKEDPLGQICGYGGQDRLYTELGESDVQGRTDTCAGLDGRGDGEGVGW